MLKFTDFVKLYEAYAGMYGSQATSAQVTPAQLTPAQLTPAQVAPAQAAPAQVTPAQAAPAGPSTADLLAAIQALGVPAVQAQTPAPETIDDVVCRIAGIKVETNKKED